jgi:ribosomal protein S14
MVATLRDFGYTSCKADPDVWMRSKTKPDGFKYWSYILVYTDDILVVDHEPQVIMDYLASRYTLKPGSVKEPDSYLDSQISKYYSNGAENPEKPHWAMSSEAYVKQAVADVKAELLKVDLCLPTRVTTPLSQGYRPELDQSRELDLKCGQYYQSLIGVLRWICELGRLDILVAISMLSRYVVSPREGHLEQVFHLFADLKHHKRSRMNLMTQNRCLTTGHSMSVIGRSFTLTRRKPFHTMCQKHVETAWLHQVLWTLTMPAAKKQGVRTPVSFCM